MYNDNNNDNKIPPTVALSTDGKTLEIIDQTKLPDELCVAHLRTAEEVRDAIAALKVRGAPAIGVAAAYGLCLGMADCAEMESRLFRERLRAVSELLAAARPTAVNLGWALDRMERVLPRENAPAGELLALLLAEARAIAAEDAALCDAIGDKGLTVLRPHMTVLTHCNAGKLATAGIGTALAPLYRAQENDYGISVYCTETRPLLQGARLTAWELSSAGIDTTLICDSAAASLMAAGAIDAVFVGCDRMSVQGDAANKIGTLGLAVIARHYGIPFYVCLPYSTIDKDCAHGADIIIEQRSAGEVTELHYKRRMAPAGIKVWSPAFDVTPADYITAIITERGVLRPPFSFV